MSGTDRLYESDPGIGLVVFSPLFQTLLCRTIERPKYCYKRCHRTEYGTKSHFNYPCDGIGGIILSRNAPRTVDTDTEQGGDSGD